MPRNFFAAFRITVRFLLKHEELLDAARTAQFYDCPTRCGRDNKRIEADYCAACPVGKEKKQFRSSVEKQLEKDAAGWRKFGFDNLLSDIYLIARLKDSKTRKTLRLATMEAIFDSEKSRAKRFAEQ